MLKRILSQVRDPLYKNSIFLMLSSITGAGTGFIFWIIAARFYSAEDVGLASAIISAMRLIAMFSVLGLDLALIRFIPEKESKSEIINSALVITASVSVLISVAFVLYVEYISMTLTIIKKLEYFILFIVFTVAITLAGLFGQGIFVAFRRAKYTFVQNISTFLRLFLLPLFVSLGAIGIFLSFGVGMVLAVLLAFAITVKCLPYRVNTIGFNELKDMVYFSFGVYIARIFDSLPGFVLPIIVLSVLGSEQNAYFYIAWWVMFFITMIARMTSMSLLAEGSYEPEKLREKVFEGSKFVLILTSVAMVLMFVFGDYVLTIFGKTYAENSFSILRVLLVGVIPYAVNVMYASAMMVRKRVMRVVVIYGCTALITIVFGYISIGWFGVLGIGYAWFIGNTCAMIGIFLFYFVRIRKSEKLRKIKKFEFLKPE